MLRGLRKASSNWLGKVVMAAVVGFLVISFAVWGIGDIFRGFGVSTVATIGGSEITIEQFRQFYNDRLQQYGRQLGRPISADQARAAGLDRQILSTLIAEAVLDERARQLGLGVSDEEVVRHVMQDPAFRGVNGQFDQQRFAYLIRQAGYTEQRFIAEQRRVTLRRQLAGTVGGEVTAPVATAEVVNRFENEERFIDYVVLDAAHAGEMPAPTPDQLRSYYDERKFLFRAPEYRKVMLLEVSPEQLAATVEVSDEDARKAYEARKTRWETPEKRQVQQISFPTPEEAKAAQEKLAGGTTFEALAAERNVAPADLDLGLVAKAEMLDPAIAEAAFGLPEGGVSAPVTGRFTTAILRVTKVEPGRTTPFADVEAQIKKEIALDRAKASLAELRDKVEDELAAGSRLDEIGAKLKLPVRIIEAVDRSGRAPDGATVALPKDIDVLGPAFSTQVGLENEALSVPGGGYLWYEVAGVTPSRERTFDEVKDRVEERWRSDEIAKRLAAKAEEIAGKLKAGGWFAEIASQDGLKVETAPALKRRTRGTLPADVIEQVFKTPKDGVGTASGATPTDRIVFKVTDVRPPPFDPAGAEAKRLLDQLRNAYADDVMAQYVARLQNELKVRINQTALAQAVGRGSAEQ
ncbi:SurA N-terminal domain-containing protein [Rhodoplanes sp. TEM]|uniref:Parvulin-like PPIase n=1 Tax=Rhodoplanes tepidamans TaxID=200616 RepID=A0ABT5JA27_RHOTP|nr:peptidylprolyl isomerase [Rhodoplanes tepidamans]MDC7786432.1 SurA N-terminal domain-containing protein [Rhodoplanes tepidamans]MDC7985074.1 SurA N-terminal domain-containing protein [Rhodoplanes sp. TEM]